MPLALRPPHGARRRPGMTDEEFKADGNAVAADLARLKHILEG
jgi:hypothetical protein